MTVTPATDHDIELPLVYRGKVRDVYELGDDLLMVASDRLSAFDVMLPTPIPGKGIALSQISRFWFAQTNSVLANHLMAEPQAAQLLGLVPGQIDLARAMVVRRAGRIDIECVARGYLAGSAWSEYQEHGTIGGVPAPAGLLQSSRLTAPAFTPAIKHDTGHDENISFRELEQRVGADLAASLRDATLRLYALATPIARASGLIIADTKFEFGWIDGELTLIDEVLTPDSSRYWESSAWLPGSAPASFDKQFVRDWLTDEGWNRRPPGPEIPRTVVDGTVERYSEVLRRLTGRTIGDFLEPGKAA